MRCDRITYDPNRMNGQPCVRNLGTTVKRVLEIVLASEGDLRGVLPPPIVWSTA